MARRRLDAAAYTVGWICALPIELAAAQVMLDEEHLPHDDIDSTQYTLGRIGSHNIVLACLPAGQMGIAPAAFSAGQTMSRFKSIRFGLMVGVGGGVPSAEADIRLGDVVVSQPYKQHGGVVQYDFGKTGRDGQMTRTGSLNAPPPALLHAVANLRARHYQGLAALTAHLAAFDLLPNFGRSQAGADVLFKSTYSHGGGATCEQCDKGSVVHRIAREGHEAVTIHYGTIASGNQVIKDGITRDRLSSELGGVLCFEMEAAGLMNGFPCLVVRGICDYADTHKNKSWQPYAAATAAAYTKELIGLVPSLAVERTDTVVGVRKYHVPFTLKGVPTGKFAARSEDTQKLEQVLLPFEGNMERRVLVVHGLGGMGKTQLAANFARHHQHDFSSVVWADGSSESSLKQSLAAFASRIPAGQIPDTSRAYTADQGGDAHTTARDVLNWLSIAGNSEWLMVIDNVDRDYERPDRDPEAYNVDEYLPEADHGSVLITTRLPQLGQLGDRWELKKVDLEQAKAIFAAWYDEQVGPDSNELLLQLDGLPLALAQAAAYMTKTSISFDTYTRLYNENWKDLMELNNTKHIPLRNYANGSVATTWTISFNSLRRSNEAAANLLLLWAHLDNKSMWYGLLSAATKISETTTKRISEWLGDIACSETEFIKAIGLLRSYSLVEKTEDRANCSTHAVVHQWALNIQNEEQLKELSWIAIVAVGKAVALRDKPTFWVPIEQLLTHANKCGNLIKEKSNAWCEQYELDAQACKNGNNDEDDWERKGGGTIPKALFCLSALYRSVGDLYKAEDICKQALSLWKRVAGEKHELTVITSNALGDIYLESGKLGEAEEAYSYALKFYEGAQREDSEFALRITYRLGRLHLAQGKPEEAARAYIRVLEGCNKMQEADGTLVLNAFRDLGAICPDPRKLTELGEMCSRVLERQTKALGTDHNSATEGMRLLAEFYMIQGRPEETETTYLQALKICEAQEIRPRVKLDLFKGFGEFYLHQSKLEDAKAIHIQAFEVCKETYGTMLEAAPTIGLVLCRICIQQGKLDEAVTWLSLMAPGYETLLAHDRAACQALQDFRVGLQKVIETRDQIKSGQETTPEATQGDIGQDTPPKETLPRRQGILQRLGWKRA